MKTHAIIGSFLLEITVPLLHWDGNPVKIIHSQKLMIIRLDIFEGFFVDRSQFNNISIISLKNKWEFQAGVPE